MTTRKKNKRNKTGKLKREFFQSARPSFNPLKNHRLKKFLNKFSGDNFPGILTDSIPAGFLSLFLLFTSVERSYGRFFFYIHINFMNVFMGEK